MTIRQRVGRYPEAPGSETEWLDRYPRLPSVWITDSTCGHEVGVVLGFHRVGGEFIVCCPFYQPWCKWVEASDANKYPHSWDIGRPSTLCYLCLVPMSLQCPTTHHLIQSTSKHEHRLLLNKFRLECVEENGKGKNLKILQQQRQDEDQNDPFLYGRDHHDPIASDFHEPLVS